MLTHDRLFVSGMPGRDPATGKIPDDPAAQVDLALDRMDAVLKAAGLELKNMVFVNPYLTTDLPTRTMNEHYARRFEFGNTPPAPRLKYRAFPVARTSSTRALPCVISHSEKQCGRKICRRVPLPVHVCLQATLCTAPPRMGSFQGRMGACTRPAHNISCGRLCATSSTIWKKPE